MIFGKYTDLNISTRSESYLLRQATNCYLLRHPSIYFCIFNNYFNYSITAKLMKSFYKIALVFVFAIFSNSLYASHYMGGEITWECNGSNQYIFTVKIYRDCNGTSLNINDQDLYVSNYPTPGVKTWLGKLVFQNFTDISATCGTKPCTGNSTIPGPDVPGAVQEFIFKSVPVTLNGVPGPDGWIFTWTNSTRNNAIDNLVNPAGASITIRAKMFAFNGQNANTCYDESPKFSEAPASILCIGSPFTYNHNAEDPELDSLVYSWAQPLNNLANTINYVEGSVPPNVAFVNGYSFNSPFPGTAQNPNNIPATLNPATGEISYQSFTSGEYVSVVRVESYRCGVKTAEIYRDIQTVLLGSCPANRAPVIVPPFQSTPGVNDSFRDTVKAGALVNFNLQAFDQFDALLNPTIDSVYVYASGRQFGANFTNPNAGCSTPPCAVFSQPMPAKGLVAVANSFSWQTTCDHIANNDGCVSSSNTYNFVIRAVDNSCPAPSQRIVTISITVLAEEVIKSPDIHCLDVKSNGDVELTWNQPIDTSNSFNAWMIFSSLNPNGPFTIVDSIFNYNTLNYTHVGAGANNAARYYYIRSRSGCNDAILTPAKDTLSTLFLNTTLDAANGCANLSWNQFNSLGSSGNYRIFRNGVQIGTTNSTTTTFCNPLNSCTGSINYRVQRDNSLVACQSSSNVFNFNYTAPDPVADFSFVASCSSLPVVFTDLSTVTSGVITSWSWNFGDGSGTSTQQNPSYTYTAVGTYNVTLTVTTNLNCTKTITKQVAVTNSPPVDAGINKSICVGGNVQIGGAPTTLVGNSVLWSPATGLSSTTAFNPTASPAVTTTYTVTVSDASACTSVDQVTVTVSNIPTANAGTDKTICAGSNTVIGGSPTTNSSTATISWSPATGLSSTTAANPTANPTTTTTYTVVVSDGPNCTATDQVVVTVNPIPTANAGADKTICTGGSVVIGGSPTTTAGNTVTWSPATGLSSTSAFNPTANPSTTTTYTVTVRNSNGCTSTDQVVVSVNANAAANAGADKTICVGGNVAIGGSPTGSPGSNYAWSPSTGLSSTSVANPVASPSTTTNYTVLVTDVNGCTGTDQVRVTVNPSAFADAGPDKIICVGVGQPIGGSPTGNIGSTYLWSPSTGLSSATASNPTANPASTTIYTVLVTDANGCTGTDQVTVSIGAIPSVDAGADKTICIGSSTTIGGSPTGAAGSTFSWSPATGLSSVSVANPIANPTTTRTYTVVVTDAAGCTASDQVVVNVNPSPVVSAGTDKSICPGGSIAIGGSPTSATGVSFSWSPAGTLSNNNVSNPIASPIVNTIYTVTVTDANGCTATDDVEVTINSVPTADAGADKIICDGKSTTIGGSPTGPAGASYAWSPATGLSSTSVSNPTANPTVTTDYTVTVTSGVGCSSTDIVRVTVNPNPTVDAGVDQVICNGSSVVIGGSPTSATAITYSWTPITGLNNTSISNPVASPTTRTTYTVLVTDANGCTSTDQVVVDINASPVVSAGADQSICPGGSIAIGGSPTGPIGSTYTWSPSASLSNSTVSNPIASPLVNTIYTVTVTDANGCTATDDVEVTINALPSADAGTDKVICNGNTTTIGGSPTGPSGATYSWSPTTGLSSAIVSNPTANPTITTDYTVTVTSGVGCTSTDVVRVTVNPNPTVDAGADQTVCVGFSTPIGGSPTSPTATSFSWTPATTLSNATSSNPVATPLVTTTYTVVVTDVNGCTATDQVTVNVNQSPTVSAGPDQAICPGGSIAIGGNPTGPAGSSYSWSPSGTLSSSTVSNPIASPVVNTIYTVTVTDVNGCTATDDVEVTINPLPNADAGVDQTICNGKSTVIGGSPTGPIGATYSWSPSTGLSSTIVSNPTANPTVTTDYTVTVTSGAGCTSTDVVRVNVNPNPIVDAGSDQTICAGFSATIGGSPTSATATSFAWTPAATLNNPSLSNPTASPLTTTIYTVIATDGNGCTATDQVTVIVNQSPTVSAGADQAICIGGSVAIGGNPTGPAGSSYVWSPSATLSSSTVSNPIATPTTTTVYTVTVTDANGCVSTDDIEITVNPLPIVDAGSDQIICLGESAPIGGSPTGPAGSTYLWSPTTGLTNFVASNPSASPSVTTTYSVLVTDVNGCTASDQVTVTVNPLPTVSAGPDVFVCLNDTVAIGGAPTSPTGVSYAWSPASSLINPAVANPRAFPIVPTVYTVTVTDANGCTATDDVLVSINPLPTIDAGDSAYVCPGFSTQLQATGGLTYTWDPHPTLSNLNISNPLATPTASTTYYVTGFDANGCRSRDSVFVLYSPAVPTEAGADQTICLNDSVTLGGMPTSPLNTTYSWTPAAGLSNPNVANPKASPATTTKYYVMTTNDTCVGLDSVIVTVNPIITAAFSATTNCLNDTTIFTDLSSITGGTITNWSWDFGDASPLVTAQNPKHLYLTAGTFNVKLVVTSDMGCKDSITNVVTVHPNPSAEAGPDFTICSGDTVIIGGSPTGAPANTFAWSPNTGLSNPSIPNPNAFPTVTTKYFVTVTDANGCFGIDSMTITVNPLPVVDAGSDVTICEQEETQLTATGALNYTWTPVTGLSNAAIANPIANPIITTKYYVTGVDGNGCENIDSVTVFVNPRPVALFEADTVCQGAVTTFTDLSTVATGSIVDWNWDFGDGVGTSNSASPTYTYGNHGVFNVQLIVTSDLACSDTFNLNIQVDTLPLTDAGPDITYCFGDTAQINATGASSYIWTPATGLSNPTIANPKVFTTTTTTYTVVGIGANGCFKSDRITVTVNPLPVIDAGNDLAVCIGDTVILGGIPSGPVGAKYTWTPSTQLNFDTVQNPICSPLVTTMYYLEVEDGNACVAIDSILVTVNPLPVVDAGVDTVMCKGDIVQMQATGALTYAWSPIIGLSDPFIANPIAFPDTTTTYIVIGTDINGCFDRDTVVVEVFDVTISDIELCETESVRLSPVLSGDTTGITYLWSPSADLNNDTIKNPIANPLVTTKYFLEVRNALGCYDIDSMIVEVKPKPIADFELDFTPECEGLLTNIENRSINGIDYKWIVNGSLDTISGFEPLLDFTFNSVNSVTLIAQNQSCSDSIIKAVNIGNVDNYLELVQTNVFSPNGDGINDVFRINYKGDLANCVEVTIFNRWGEVVYTSNTEKSGWDGRTQSGEKAAPGTYFYVIQLQDAQVKGSVFLTR